MAMSAIGRPRRTPLHQSHGPMEAHPLVQQIRSGPFVPVLEPDNSVSAEKAQAGDG